MKLEKWALLAEIISGLAIVVTLIVLILEVRTNTELSRLSAYQTVTQDFDEWRRDVSGDSEKLNLFVRYTRGAYPDPSTPEWTELYMIILNSWSAQERAYFAHEAGIIGETEWVRIQRSACSELLSLEANQQLHDDLYFRLTDAYKAHLETACK